MDQIVSKKLLKDDKCICSIQGSSVDGHRRTTCVLAIIENHEDHGVFAYDVKEGTSQDPKNLVLTATMSIDNTFLYSIVSSQNYAGVQGVIVLRMDCHGQSRLFELPYGDALKFLLSELKRTVQLSSQNAGFGLPSTFSWMSKYGTTPGPGVAGLGITREQSNPRNTATGVRSAALWDAFDPLSVAEDHFTAGSTISTSAVVSDNKSTASEWPYNQIFQLNAGGQCPVVKDTLMHYSSSDQNLKSMAASAESKDTLYPPIVQSNKALRRSYEKNLNKLTSDPTGVKSSAVLSAANQMVTVRGGSMREIQASLLMKEREADFTKLMPHRVFCGTYNVNGQAAQSGLSQWLATDPSDQPPDIYAVGFQELDLSTNAYIFSESAKEEEWYNKVKDSLHPGCQYRKVKLVRLVGMMLVVFIRESLARHVTEILAETCGTGLLGMVGNKGGVSVRFKLYDTTLCFVNSHLAAHMEEYERRNQDFRVITSRLLFGSPERPIAISDHDVVFWLGDLNYRISDIDGEDCKKMINNKQLRDLMNYDQLSRQKGLKRVFLDYFEGDIKFPPTYKYDPGTDNFDTSEKCRNPAWCDRVLSRGSNIEQLNYKSHPELKLSDHKPVSALYSVGFKIIDAVLERRVHEDVMKTLDQRENEGLPQVSLDVTEVFFKDVKFIELQRRLIEVTNIGQVPVQFEFINKPGDTHYCKSWLNVEPYKGLLRSAGQSVSLSLEVYVTKESAPKLNNWSDKLEDILVLHLDGGKDFFISVSGNYLPSCFGSSIETLVSTFGPIRDIATDNLLKIDRGVSLISGQKPFDIPKELYRLVDALYRNGLNEDELFQQPGSHNEITQIRDCLDTGSPLIIPGTVHSVGESFVSFLEALSEPVIPYSFYDRCLASNGDFNACKQVLAQIPVSHRNVFKYVCAFLRQLLIHSSKNKLDIKFLATLFGNVLLRPPPPTSKDSTATGPSGVGLTPAGGNKTKIKMEQNQKSAIFVFNFLINEYDE